MTSTKRSRRLRRQGRVMRPPWPSSMNYGRRLGQKIYTRRSRRWRRRGQATPQRWPGLTSCRRCPGKMTCIRPGRRSRRQWQVTPQRMRRDQWQSFLGLLKRLALTKARVSRVKRINRLRKESRLPAGGVVVTQMRRCVIALLLAASLPASYDEECLELFDRFRGVALRHLSLFFPLGSCLPVRDAGAVVGVGLG